MFTPSALSKKLVTEHGDRLNPILSLIKELPDQQRKQNIQPIISNFTEALIEARINAVNTLLWEYMQQNSHNIYLLIQFLEKRYSISPQTSLSLLRTQQEPNSLNKRENYHVQNSTKEIGKILAQLFTQSYHTQGDTSENRSIIEALNIPSLIQMRKLYELTKRDFKRYNTNSLDIWYFECCRHILQYAFSTNKEHEDFNAAMENTKMLYQTLLESLIQEYSELHELENEFSRHST